MEVHILNGDCLKKKLKDKYSNLLVMREALMQGPIEEKDEKSFFENRALFLSKEYNVCTKEDYFQGMDEFIKMKAINEGTIIHLWFGKDVFCQVNFWFLLKFLEDKIETNDFYLVSPRQGNDCSFSKKSKEAFKKRTHITKEEFKIFCKLWTLFVNKEYLKMENEIESLKDKYPFLIETIEAIKNIAKVEKEFLKLYKEEKDFKKLFQKVCKDYSIYGYGDLQVRYIVEKKFSN